MKKRLISLLLVIALCLGILPSPVFAAGETDIGLGTLEAEDCTLVGDHAGIYTDSAASGGKGVDNLYFVGDGIVLGKLKTPVDQLTIRYCSMNSGTFGLYVDDEKVQDITITANGAWNGSYTETTVTFSPELAAGSVLSMMVNNQGECWNLDKFVLSNSTITTFDDAYANVKLSDIYDTKHFAVISDAANVNHPHIDTDTDSLGWLGDGACVAVKSFDFGSNVPERVQLHVEMSRDTSAIEAEQHFAVYAVPSSQSISSATDLTDSYKIATQEVMGPSDDHTKYFVQTYEIPQNKLSGEMTLYILCGSGGFNLKSVQFAAPVDPITVDKDNALIYNEAATVFDEALPLGNGFVGAMVYGGVDTERIGLNETTIWTGSPYENNVEGASANLDEWRKKTLNEEGANNLYFWTDKFVDNTKKDDTAYGPSFSGSQKYQLAGELNLTTGHNASTYVRYLDLDTATAVTQYSWNNSTVTRETFVSNPDRVLAMRLTSDNAPMTFTGSYDLKGMVNNGISVDGNDTLVIKGGVDDYRTVESGIEFTVRVKFIPTDGTVAAENNTITVTDTTDCTVLVVIATNFVSYNDISADEDALAKQMMDAAAAKTYAELKKDHIADYQKLYNRVELNLGGSDTTGVPVQTLRQNLADQDDPAFVELAYNFNRYLQIAASREGAQATNLQGIWNDNLQPMWDCNYTTNINLQMNYWATLSTNLEECYAPVVEKLKSLQEQGHITAKELYGITTDGAWTLHHNTDLWSVTGPVAGDWGVTPTCGAWLVNEAYTVYQYNQSEEYLSEIYPVLKGAAQFMLEFLVEDSNGQLMFCPSSSPENSNKTTNTHVAYNSAFDIQVTNELFRNVIEAAGILNCDTDMVSQLQTALEKLPPVVGVGSWDQVKEFYNYDSDLQDDTHRHLSHLYGLYPGTSITEADEDAWNAAYTTLNARSANAADETGWGVAWRILLYTRFGDKDRAYEYLKNMYKMSYQHCRENLFTVCSDVFQYDANGGMLAAVTTMLVEDQNGAELLKGLPSQWQNGSIKGIRLKGNFTLDEMVWENGVLKSATVTSHSGKTLNLTYGDKTVSMETVANETYVFDGSLSLPNDESVLFSDNFDAETTTKWKQVGSDISAEDGVLHVVGDSGIAQCAPVTEDAPDGLYLTGDAVFEFDVQPTTDWGGIQFGLENQNALNWDETGYLLYVRESGTMDLLKSNKNGKDGLAENISVPDYTTGEWVHVKVEYLSDNNQIKVYLNNQTEPAVNYTDNEQIGGVPAYTNGYVMMALNGANVDNVVIRGTHCDKSIQDAFDHFILYKPLRDASKVEYPVLPDGVQVKLVSASPAGYLDENWNVLKRPAAGADDVTVTATVRLTYGSMVQEKTYTVPISAEYVAPVVDEDTVKAAHERQQNRKLGMFVHYVQHFTEDQNGNLMEDVDALANAFDVEQFAKDMHDFGVEYVLFTSMHYNAETLYPSEVNKRWRDDNHAEGSDSKKSYSDRDVILELYEALAKYDIELQLYVHPVDGHDFSEEDKISTGFYECGGDENGSHDRWNQYQNELFDEMTKRYAGKVTGYWFDGQYKHVMSDDVVHLMFDEEEQLQLRETMLAYDPTLILTTNLGNIRDANAGDSYPATDFSAWEIEWSWGTFNPINPNVVRTDPGTWPATSEQLAMVISNNWWTQQGGNYPDHTAEDLFQYTVMQASISQNGGYLLSAGCYPGLELTNLWGYDLKDTLIQLNTELLTPVAESILRTRTGVAYPTEENVWLDKLDWGVSTESADGRYVYLHVMNKPDSNSLSIAVPADGSVFQKGAVMLNFDGTKTTGVTVENNGNGYTITLPDGTAWSDVDTIIRLERSTVDTNGDVDDDGEIDAYDAALVYEIANGKTEATEAQLAAADVNGDGEVTPMDAAMIYAYANGKMTQFSVSANE